MLKQDLNWILNAPVNQGGNQAKLLPNNNKWP